MREGRILPKDPTPGLLDGSDNGGDKDVDAAADDDDDEDEDGEE